MPELFAVFGVVGRAVSVLRIPVYPVEVVKPVKMEQIVVAQEAQTDKVSLMQIDNNGIQPDTLGNSNADGCE